MTKLSELKYQKFLLKSFNLLIIASWTNIYSQNLTIDSNANQIVTGIDSNNQNYLLFENLKDYYYLKSFNSKEWQKVSLRFNELPQTEDFPYKFIQVKARNFLIHNGCGEVYEIKSDSIIRIDNSFQHKNQYFANVFTYKDEIYFWGGYGLFTYKNILTKFNFTTKEWDILKYNDYKNQIPEPRKMALSYIENDNLYIYGGIGEDYTTPNENSNNHILNDFWKLDLRTREWEFIGNLKKMELYHMTPENHGYYLVSNTLFFDSKKFIGLNLNEDKLFYYGEQRNYELSRHEKYNPERNEIIYTVTSSNESLKDTKVFVQDFNAYKGNLISKFNLLDDKGMMFWIGVIALTIFGLSFLLKKWISFFLLRYKNVIVFNKEKIYYKNRLITNLDTQENQLLYFLFNNLGKPLSIHEITNFLADDDQDVSYGAWIKRKDTLINSLKSKLSFILNVAENDIFIINKNIADKRVKQLSLNTIYFKNI